MANVSKRALDSKLYERLLQQLSAALSQETATATSQILTDLLGPEEQTMLAKRLAAIILLQQGHSIYKTAATLHISPATAQRIKTNLENQHYDNVTQLLQTNRSLLRDLLETLDSILHLNGLLPHYGQSYATDAKRKQS